MGRLMPMVKRMGLDGVSILTAIFMKAIIKKAGEMDGVGTFITIVSTKRVNGKTTNHMVNQNLLTNWPKKKRDSGLMVIL